MFAAPFFIFRYLQGYLDIVRWLCEHGGATLEVDGAPGIDVKSTGGWTPLSERTQAHTRRAPCLFSNPVNASSKGHLPIVLYLLSKQAVDPLVRNNWGETAYDAAAAVFEIWICEVNHLSCIWYTGIETLYRSYRKRKRSDGDSLRSLTILFACILQSLSSSTRISVLTLA